ncbi:MAG: MATE family efflux transporter [Clostridia bacterium]|nr:MATE family efflux transporter [Clostridia bacterium]
MLRGNLFRDVLLFSLPLMASGLLQALYNSADMIVIGQFLGDAALASVGATAHLYSTFMHLFVGLSVGIDVVCAFSFGSGDDGGVKKTVDTAVISGVFVGLIATLSGLLFARPLLVLMKTPVEDGVLDGAVLYMKTVFFGAPFTVIYNFCAAVLRTSGDTKRPFIYLSVAGALNVALNVLFVAAFGMGIFGVAFATVISQAVSAVLILVRLCRNKGLFSFSLRGARFSMGTFIRIFYVGILAGLQEAMFSIANSFMQAGVNSFGEFAVAGNTAADTIENFIWIMASSFSYATVTFISANLGAGQFSRIRKAFSVTVLYSVGTALVVGMGCFFAGRTVLSLFVSDAASMEFALKRTGVTFPLYFLAGFMAVLPSALRGFGHSLAPTVVNLITVCAARITWIYTAFAWNPTPETLYLIHPITWILTDAALFTLTVIYYRKIVRNTAEKHETKLTV